ncbi:MAG: VWA domain-containing protein [Kiritimatiellae bacterium]|nr:VWA domain-containing protein [Kiritimatiellia bacterium]
MEIQRLGIEQLPVLPKDILFIQDGSRSMKQAKLNGCKQGLTHWLNVLNEEDRFNVIAFREDVTWCFNTWHPVHQESKQQAYTFIDRLRAQGKTDVYASLKPLLNVERDPERTVMAILITDGRPTMGMVESSDIIETFSRANQSKVSVFSFGGGTRVNHFLLDLLSYKNRGDSYSVEDRQDITRALGLWAKALNRPVLADLSYHFSGVEDQEIYPRILTHLYLDRPLIIYGRIKDPSIRTAFRVVGHSRGGIKRDLVFQIDLSEAQEGDTDIPEQWAWHKVYHLIGKHLQTQEPDLMDEIELLAKQYDIVVPYGDNYPVIY